MASGSARAVPVHGGCRPYRLKLTRGQLYSATISVQMTMHQLACSLADFGDIPLSTPTPYTAGRSRPFIFLLQDEQGIHGIPLSTFEGSDPAEWNLLQRAIALPFGDNILSIFHDRPVFQTQPAWNHQDGLQTYIVPRVVILPVDTTIRRLRQPAFMDGATVKRLEDHCLSVVRNLENGPLDDLVALIKSYENKPAGKLKPVEISPSVQESINSEVTNGQVQSTLNPEAPAFIPRAAQANTLSFPDLAGSGCGSTIAFTIASSVTAPSVLQALQNTIPPREVDAEPRKPSGAHKEDKENLRL